MASNGNAPTSFTGARVLMLVRNSGEFDTRVRKEATTLAAAGFHVRVLAIASDGLPDQELVGDVEYERIRYRSWLIMAGRDRYARAQATLRAQYLERVAAAVEFRDARSDAGARRGAGWLLLTMRLVLLLFIRLRILMARLRLGVGRRVLRVIWGSARRGYSRVRPWLYHIDYGRSAMPAMERFAPHVVHAHDLNTLYVARKYARRHAVPLVYDSHELELHRNAVWTRTRRIIARVVETLGIRTAAAVITVSPAIADELAKTYRITRPTLVLNSPPLESRDLEPTCSLRAIAGLSESDSLVVYVGGVQGGRGLEQLVDALAYMPPKCHVGLLGPRVPDRDENLVKRAEALGVADRLHLFAPLPSSLVPAALREAAVSVIPIQNVCRSYDLALPNKLFDAVMAGVPIAVANLVVMRRFVTEYRLGEHFDETDPKSIAQTVQCLVNERPAGLLDKKSLDALQRSVCWEEQEHNLRSIYARITNGAVAEALSESHAHSC